MNKKFIIIICMIFILILTLSLLVYFFKIKSADKAVPIASKQNTLDDVFFNLNTNTANIDSFLIYGTHLNISGNAILPDTSKEILNSEISFINADFNEINYKTNYKIKDGTIFFETSNYINSGIFLDNINVNQYIILFKINFTDNSTSYYTFLNSNNFEELEYFTISQNNKTNKLNFKYKNSYITLNIENIDTPEEVFDICIDAGHGGNDPGATYKGFEEATITLDYAISLKHSLEKHGIKVALTRTDNTRVKNYGNAGRATLPYEVKSKYTFSIHLNSSNFPNKNSGIEVYSPNKCELSFAKSIADNIVSICNSTYSKNNICKVDDGVYVRVFTENEIEEFAKDAKRDGYTLYENLTIETPYLFMIRETGGKSTSAYFDGRNKNYEPNYYYNSNIGNESYLLEIGYINNISDIKNITENKEMYINTITKSIVDKINSAR